MITNLPTEFVNKLIKDTLSDKLKWEYLTENMDFDGEHITNLLSVCEFHTVHFWESYYCNLGNGYVFLVGETNESGRDGTITEGYNLYLQISLERPLVSLMIDTVEVYRLKNAVESKIDIAPDIVEFMQSFLEN